METAIIAAALICGKRKVKKMKIKRRKEHGNTLVSGRNGFTLAEVLITLVIIGVIAALTIPTLIQNTQKQEFVTGLKKAYSTLSQVTQQIITEEGSPKGDDGWAKDIETIYHMYRKYLNNIKECGSGTGCFGQMKNGVYKNLDNSDVTWSAESSSYRKLILADGTQVMFANASNNCTGNWIGSADVCAHIFVDINGEKTPNKRGRDLFTFDLKENGLYPAGCNVDDCIGNKQGTGCTCKVLREGAMNY